MTNAAERDETGGRNLQFLVKLLNAEKTHAIAKIVRSHRLDRRFRHDADREICSLLGLGQTRPHTRSVMRYRHGFAILINRAMGNAIIHAEVTQSFTLPYRR